MKRSMKQRSFGKGEMPNIATQCMKEIYNGRDVINFLIQRGSTDPINEWYDIRRWIKSNDPTSYASIPMNLRLELPVHNDNPAEEKKEEVKVETVEEPTENFESALVKKKPGRKPKQKEPIDVAVQLKRYDEPKIISRVHIDSVTGNAAKYEWCDAKIKITANDACGEMIIDYSALKDMLEELPEVIDLLGR